MRALISLAVTLGIVFAVVLGGQNKTATLHVSGAGAGGGGGTGNAFTHVQTDGGATDGGGSIGTTISTNFVSNVGAGHVLTAQTLWQVASGSATAAITDTTGNTWVACGGPEAGVAGLANYYGQTFYVLSSNSGNPLVTLTTSGTDATLFRGIEISEWSSTGTISLHSSCSGTTGYSNTAASGGLGTGPTVTTTVTNALVIGMCLLVDSGCTLGSGWTSANTGMNGQTGGLTEYKTATTTGAYAPTFGAGTTDAIVIGAIAFKAQ